MSRLKRFGLPAAFVLAGMPVLVGVFGFGGSGKSRDVVTKGASAVRPEAGDGSVPRALRGVDSSALSDVARRAVASYGEPDTGTAEIVQTTMADVRTSIDESDDPPDERRVVIVQVAGDFMANAVPMPSGADAPKGHELDLIYQVDGLEPAGISVGNTGMDLKSLGPVTTLDLGS